MKNKKNYLNIQEIHSALLGILTEFDRICRKHNLKYSLTFGTLIGAVRHKGFIPWDDDVDVIMPRPDYEKFRSLALSGELGEHFLLSDDRGKKAFYPFLKLMDERYGIKTWSHREVPYLYIDIFPLDGAPEGDKAITKKFRRRTFYNGLAALARWAVPDKKRYLILRLIGFPFYLIGTLYGNARASKNALKNALKDDYESSEKVAIFVFCLSRAVLDRKMFDDLVELPFEDRSFYAIAAYDKYLRNDYGDYMTPPPKNKQVTHGLRVKKFSARLSEGI
ncbi:MAG: LicD family protein [Clostridiales bacterium]|nr:LicD family protein [Clostridiales bacterium]